MRKLLIKETLNSPKVILDPSKKRYEISGKSFPENSKTFYQPVFDWITEAATTLTDEKIHLSLTFEYISSSSVITLKQLLSKIKALSEKGLSLQILWYYDSNDQDIKEIGEEYQKLVDIDMQFVEKEGSPS
jgi:hypothetical protein